MKYSLLTSLLLLSGCALDYDANGDLRIPVNNVANSGYFEACGPQNLPGCSGALDRKEINAAAAAGRVVFVYPDGRKVRYVP